METQLLKYYTRFVLILILFLGIVLILIVDQVKDKVYNELLK